MYHVKPYKADFSEFVTELLSPVHPARRGVPLVERLDRHVGLLGLSTDVLQSGRKEGESTDIYISQLFGPGTTFVIGRVGFWGRVGFLFGSFRPNRSVVFRKEFQN